MSYNLVNPTTGDLTRVAGNSNIVDTAIKTDSTWSSKKISADLADKQDFRIFKSLEEFNEKKGTSLTVVSGVDNMKDIANAMSNGEMLIIITKCELDSEVYFGLTTDTGWAKMFTFVKSNGLCDVECRTTFPLTLKRVLNSDGVVGDWQKVCTTTVEDVPITYISPADTTTFVNFKNNALCNYRVINGICYVNLEGISIAYSGQALRTGVYLPKNAYYQGGTFLTGAGDATPHAYVFVLKDNGELCFDVKDTNTLLYGSFSYPVAES